MKLIKGKCSLCGGNVVLPQVWFGVNEPTPTCESCGATEKSNLPVIPMEKPIKRGKQPIIDYKSNPIITHDSKWR